MIQILPKYLKIIGFIVIFHWTDSVYGQYTPKINIDSNHFTYKTLFFNPVLRSSISVGIISTPFNISALPFFCKIEHKIESNSNIAFRFRLGDLNYVNMLENKR